MNPEQTRRPEVIPGQQIFLSHVRRDDVPQIASWFADLELTTYLGVLGTSFTLEQEEQWFSRLSNSPDKLFGIVAREQNKLIGTMGLSEIDYRHGHAELGIAIGDKSAWGKGYGSEAVRLLADYGLSFLGLHTIYLWHVAFNERGHRAYLKAGFKEAGRIRGAVLLDGQRYDRVLMDVTRADLGPSQLIGMVRQLQQEG